MARDPGKEAILNKKNRRAGEFLEALGHGVGLGELQPGTLKGFSVRLATEKEPSTLLILRASTVEGAWVAFVGAFSVTDALLAWRARAEAGRVKWREDVPWADRKRDS